MYGCDEAPCGCRSDGLLEVLGQASVSVEPSQGTLHDPASRQDFEALGCVGSLDDVDGPFSDAAQRVFELVPSIAAIGEDVPQPREGFNDFGQHQRCPVAVLDVGGVDEGMDEIALGVGEDMALASFDLLAGVISPRTAGFRGFDALAVDHTGGWARLTPLLLAHRHRQDMVDREPQTIVAPQVEPAPHRRDRRETRRQHPPRQAAPKQIKDRLHDPAQRPFPRAADRGRSRQQRFQQRPFRIGQITWQSQAVAGMKGAGGISPHRGCTVVFGETPESPIGNAVKLTR